MQISEVDKVILWAGGYGAMEKLAFKKFLKAYQAYREAYTLKITIHPGLKKYSPEKLQLLLKDYYLDALHAYAFPKSQIQQVITSLDSLAIVSVSHAVVSLNSAVGAQAIFLGRRAKNVYLDKHIEGFEGIECVKTKARWHNLFEMWLSESCQPSDADSLEAKALLGIPEKTTEQVLFTLLRA